ncbi:putative inorganic phosphate transporter 1-3 [Quercus suber]|uniref:Inorganic phosphate transporter 1-3 n=1 Tax=Quercus suber TaxID=58331 RepID=A0AAW0LSB3_QUESU
MATEKIGVLKALDSAKVQLYHFTAIVITGMGFFTDAYDIFCISIVTKLLGRIYYTEANPSAPGTLPPSVNSAVTAATLCGTFAGQLFFGWLGDKLGRKRVYGVTLLLMVFCSIASGLSFGKEPAGVITTLCFFRFWLGFGIGGDYPLSATIMSEYANKRTRGAFIAAVFAMQGIGILFGGIVGLTVAGAFNDRYKSVKFSTDAIKSLPPQADYVWRIILMVGALPAALTYYWRMKMPETARYTALVARNAKQAAADMSMVLQVEVQPEMEVETAQDSYGLFSMEFAKRHGLPCLEQLFVGSWWTSNLFQKNIFTAVNWLPKAKDMSAIEEVYKIARAQTLIALVRTVPDPAPQRTIKDTHAVLELKDTSYPAGVNLAGVLFTCLVPESKGKSLEELTGENEEEMERPLLRSTNSID